MPVADILSPYTFGAMSLGSDLSLLQDHLRVVRQAMDAGVSVHASPTYHRGFSFMVLRMAFDEQRSKVPPLILKIRDGSAALMRFETEDCCRRLGIDGIDVAQLVSMNSEPGNLLDQLDHGGPIADEYHSLRERGLIRHAAVFVNRQNCEQALAQVQAGHIEALIGYWNCLQRPCTDQVWQSIQDEHIPLLALRTLAGGPGHENVHHLHERLQELCTQSACRDLVELNLRLAASYPCVQTSIGGTGKDRHLQRYLEAMHSATALDAQTLREIEDLRGDA